ncbi:hypothetical protein CEXT_273941 [Caerostris extrusa]|uniref:Uncharacterized protein n=1 Tax=Caerostris extrusa TaxID=172846 RepID=A0AAV4NTG7_CAEEX|nr:hypothetical protein CEXT_273941 [Caerostris extrusa]
MDTKKEMSEEGDQLAMSPSCCHLNKKFTWLPWLPEYANTCKRKPKTVAHKAALSPCKFVRVYSQELYNVDYSALKLANEPSTTSYPHGGWRVLVHFIEKFALKRSHCIFVLKGGRGEKFVTHETAFGRRTFDWLKKRSVDKGTSWGLTAKPPAS